MRIDKQSSFEDKSFWLRSYGQYLANPVLSANIKADVCIIGGGFTGLSTAYGLKK